MPAAHVTQNQKLSSVVCVCVVRAHQENRRDTLSFCTSVLATITL